MPRRTVPSPPGTRPQKRGISTPRKISSGYVSRQAGFQTKVSTCVQEGNRAVPVQLIYENTADSVD